MERKFPPIKIANISKGHLVTMPVEFIQDISRATDIKNVLDVVSQWMLRLFDAERASITLCEDTGYLKLFSISGNEAIPIDFKVPISKSLVGRAYSEKMVIICDDLEKSTEIDCVMLAQSGLGTCMDAPLIYGDFCLGTLNVAHKNNNYYTEAHAVELQCLANFVALNINLRRQVVQLEKLASTDHLTGAANRRVFSEKIQHDIRQFHEGGHCFFLALMDLDYFKKLNDRFGHMAGDYVLKQIVHISNELLGEQGGIYRMGGEEFSLLLHCQHEAEAINLCESIKAEIGHAALLYEEKELFVTVSMGVTVIGADDHNPETLLIRADEALYQAKVSGRNRVIMNRSNVEPMNAAPPLMG